MTKQRFIKLLMADGVPRNQARTIAFIYNQFGIPYKDAYRVCFTANSFKKPAKSLGESLCNAADHAAQSIQYLAESLSNFILLGGNKNGSP